MAIDTDTIKTYKLAQQMLRGQPSEEILTPARGVAGLLGRSRKASESEGIYDEGQGGNWFEEMFLKRTGGGGKDYIIPEEAKEIDEGKLLAGVPLRPDLEAKKIEAERMDFTGKMMEKFDKLYEEDQETFFKAQKLWDILR